MQAEKIIWISEPDYTHWKEGCQQYISWKYKIKGSDEIHEMHNDEHAAYVLERQILEALKELPNHLILNNLISRYGQVKYVQGRNDLEQEYSDNRI